MQHGEAWGSCGCAPGGAWNFLETLQRNFKHKVSHFTRNVGFDRPSQAGGPGTRWVQTAEILRAYRAALLNSLSSWSRSRPLPEAWAGSHCCLG